MSTTLEAKPSSELELVISRLIDAPPANVYRAWIEPALIKQWFAPKPWSVSKAETDPRPGGSTLVVMKGPDGQEMPCPGIYLELVPNRKIVTTDAYTNAWQPSAKPFMTTILTFEDQNGKTKYTARVLHWNKEDCEAHRKMGFAEGWGVCADQLEEIARKL